MSSGDLAEATFESWESELLQMGSYVVLTTLLFQEGSRESKSLDADAPQDADPPDRTHDPHAPWPFRRGCVALARYENSLLILFAVLFIDRLVVSPSYSSGARSSNSFAAASALMGEPSLNWPARTIASTGAGTPIRAAAVCIEARRYG